MRRAAALLPVIGVVLAGGCGEESSDIGANELPALLEHAFNDLEAPGHDVRGVAVGPADTPVIVVEDGGPVVVLSPQARYTEGVDNASLALSEFSEDRRGGMTVIVCDLVVVAPEGTNIGPVARASGACNGTPDR